LRSDPEAFFYSDADLKTSAVFERLLGCLRPSWNPANSSLPGGENRRHLEMLVNGEKPQAGGKKQSNPTGDPDRWEQVAQ
jgi:hypothetical protein